MLVIEPYHFDSFQVITQVIAEKLTVVEIVSLVLVFATVVKDSTGQVRVVMPAVKDHTFEKDTITDRDC